MTNLEGVAAGQVLSCYARRWGVEVTIKELKGGLHLGRMQVTKDAARVSRSVGLSILAYLMLVRLYGKEAASAREYSLFWLKQRFMADVHHEQLNRTVAKWQAKVDKYRLAA